MKIASAIVDSHPTYGLVTEDGFAEASADLRAAYPTLRAMIAASSLAALEGATEPARPLERITFLPVIPDPDKIILVGLNYESHRLEGAHPPLDHPTIFTRFANSQVGHLQPIVKPRVSEKLDFEGELAFVIGTPAFEVAEADALGHVAGYACYNDGSVRDWQRHGTQWIPGKNFPSTGAFGPWLVSRDEIPDVAALELTTRLNGEVMQSAGLDDLIFPVERLIAYCSTFSELVPGDVIVTGTTGGVGHRRSPPIYMRAGDVVEVEISGIGTLRNPVRDQ